MALIATPTANIVSASNNALKEPPAVVQLVQSTPFSTFRVLVQSLSWLVDLCHRKIAKAGDAEEERCSLPKYFHVASSCRDIERRHAGYIFLVWHTDFLQELKDRHTIDDTGSHMQEI